MTLDELKDKWADHDRKLQSSTHLNAQLLCELRLQKTAPFFHRLSRSLVVELLLNVAVVVLLGLFLANYGGDLKFLVPAIALDLFALFLLVSCAYQLAALGNVDFSAPVLVLQKKLETLKVRRIRATQWGLLLAPLIWVPLLIVTFQGVFGVDPYAVFAPEWLLVNLLAGAAVIPLMIWASRRYADRLQRSPLVQRLMNDIAGRNLVAATAYLDTLSRFEQEQERP